MHSWLVKDKGYCVNFKRIERLYYKVMGLRSRSNGKSIPASEISNTKRILIYLEI